MHSQIYEEERNSKKHVDESMTKQVKSKQRVAKHGEVFTAPREVNAMLDLVKQETERIDSRFLEPACGEGVFLEEILRRKLAVVKRNYKKNPSDYEKYAVLAASSIYGVDLLQDNVEACQKKLFELWDEEYRTICKNEVNEDCQKAVKFILSRNIVCGNALSLKKVDSNTKDTKEPIVFSEWAFVTGSMLQRSDYTFDKLLEGDEEGRDLYSFEAKKKRSKPEQQSLFGQPGIEKPNEEGEFLKKIISHYRKVQENG
jgi:hypothetical protein